MTSSPWLPVRPIRRCDQMLMDEVVSAIPKVFFMQPC